ncbi:MAG: hypothetical protein J5734_01005 [Prevotella sp.]|nr:hypothetical protein [Prevotella sp.]MBR5035775.1 hypothetical protein [Prevotella sp.]
MKQLFLILISMVCGSVHAQSNMNISDLFEGKVVPASQMVETRIRGKAISQYKLTYFHSVRFKADEALVKRVDHLAVKDFVNDSEKLKDRKPDSRGFYHSNSLKVANGKKSFTQMYELAPYGSTNRYLCYKVVDDVMTVIYLEGSVSSLDELKKIFKD